MGLKAIFRSITFSLLIIFLSNMPWDVVSKQDVIPFQMFKPFSIYLYDKIFTKASKQRYQQVLQTFIDTPELRFLAVPPKLGGPPNQNTYVVLGFSMLFTLFLVSFPQSAFQFIGFLLGLSHTFGYWMSLHHFRFYEYTQMPFTTYVYVFVCLLGIVTIISDPIEMIKSLFKKNKKVKEE